MIKFSETNWGMKFINRKPYEISDMIDNGVRDAKIEARRQMTECLYNQDVVTTINQYFDDNRTMGGEKIIRDTSHEIKQEFDQVSSMKSGDSNWNRNELYALMNEEYNRNGMTTTFRHDLINDYSRMCVKQVKLLTHDMSQIQSENGFEKLHDNTYELPVVIGSHGDLYADSAKTRKVGCIVPSFLENHQNTEGLSASLIVVDNTGGKLLEQNCSFRVIVDLGQGDLELALTMDKPHAHTEQDTEKVDKEIPSQIDDDFANAVASIPIAEELNSRDIWY